MTGPVFDFAGDPQGVQRSVRSGHIAGESLVREVWIVLERAGGFDDINVAAAFASGEFRSPRSRVECGAEIDVLETALDEIAAEAGRDQIAHVECRLGSMIEESPVRD